jgi:hypothetical protein
MIEMGAEIENGKTMKKPVKWRSDSLKSSS